MAEKSRTEHSVRNTSTAMISKIIAILMGFVTRVVFTHVLSESYVGVNGLFSDILNVLALSELGVGTAITYALYKPIVNKDFEKQKSLMRLYRTFYFAVAGIVLVAGLCIIPFMGILIKNQPQVEHLILIYLLYLANSVLSYLLIYKRTLIDAHQLSYLSEIYFTVFLIIQDIFQIIILLTTGNFILFLTIYIICTLGNNISISRKANKMYPYLKDKDVKPLDKEEKHAIFKNIRAMLMHKIGDVVVNNTDNLLLSSIVGIVSVGCYSNYYLVVGSVHQVLGQIFRGITASVGNLGVTENSERVRKIFETSFFIGQWMYGFAMICLFELLNPFVEISFGKNYVFSLPVVLIICFNFYVTGMRQATLVFRDSLGIFWFDRYKSLANAILNLGISILLARQFGTIGVFSGTLISALITSVWVEPYVLYKHSLKVSVFTYFKKFLFYCLVAAVAGLATHEINEQISGNVYTIFFLRLIVCLVVPNIIMLLCYVKTREFHFIIEKMKALLAKRRGISVSDTEMKDDKADNNQSEKEECREWILTYLAKDLNEADTSWQDLLKKDRLNEKQWGILYREMKRQGVQTHLASILSDDNANQTSDTVEQTKDTELLMPEYLEELLRKDINQIVLQNYRLWFLTKYLVNSLNEKSIQAVVLKGASTARLYPVPELRKSGDVDLLIGKKQILKAREVLENKGFSVCKNQHSVHHLMMRYKGEDPVLAGIIIELHETPIQSLTIKKVTHFVESEMSKMQGSTIVVSDAFGIENLSFEELSMGYHGYYLLLHMLQHFFAAGFGLKLLCDWVRYFNALNSEAEKTTLLRCVKESGLQRFFDLVTSVCVQKLGLPKERVKDLMTEEFPKQDCQMLLEEIWEAGEFGAEDNRRMVLLTGTGLSAYVKEFHHQTKNNFPKSSRVFLLWPVLWLVTLVRFLRNNRKIRNKSSFSIMRTAGERSAKIKKMDLFR